MERKYIIKAVLPVLLIGIMLLCSCGTAKPPEAIEVSTVILENSGSVTSYLVEDFDKSYYDVSELSAMAAEDAAAFNEKHQQGEEVPLTMVKVETVGSDKVLVRHDYMDTEIFEAYNERELFFGTVEEALAQGYDLGVVLFSIKTREALSHEELMQKAQKSHVLITDAKAVFYCPYPITHVGDGVGYLEDGSVDTTPVEGTVVVLMQKK